MKNLELKIDAKEINIEYISKYYIETLIQKDTYFQTRTGRLKLREEKGKGAYVIYYNRPDVSNEKISDYIFYPIENSELFFQVFGNALKEEIVIEKERKLYIYKDARIHFDTVKNLGNFLEIEVILKKDNETAQEIMNELVNILNIKKENSISYGYREMLLFKKNNQKDLEYYSKQNKVFWVVNKDINEFIKANDIVPCIFVEKKDDGLYILQLEENIKFDDYKYTAWRSLLGSEYNIYVDVLLICNNNLYNLQNKIINFSELKRSNVVINKDLLAKIGVKKKYD